MNIGRISVGAALFSSVVTFAACAGDASDQTPPAGEDEETSNAEQDLSYRNGHLWGTKLTGATVPVCFSSSLPGTAAQQLRLRNNARVSWEHVANVKFTGWGTCGNDLPDGTRVLIRIYQTNEAPEASTGKSTYMSFPWFPNHVESGVNVADGDAVHEFGHVLGFYHEQQRSDAPQDCGGPTDPNYHDEDWGHQPADMVRLNLLFDRNSIMSYCCPPAQYQAGYLDDVDVRNVRQLYGGRKAGLAVFNPTNGLWSVDENRNQIWDPPVDYQAVYGSSLYGPMPTSNVPALPSVTSTGDSLYMALGYAANGYWKFDLPNNNKIMEPVDYVYTFGSAGVQPVSGYWTGRQNYQRLGVFQPSTGGWWLDMNATGAWDSGDKYCNFGGNPSQGVPGNYKVPIDNDHDRIAVFRDGSWWVDSNDNCTWDGTGTGQDNYWSFGTVGDIAVPGDWDGDGRDNLAVYTPSTGKWTMDTNENFTVDASDTQVVFGSPTSASYPSGDKPVVMRLQ